MASIACADCGQHRHRCPSNTKYCKKCRLLRDVEFWEGKTRTCRSELYDRAFAPLHRHDAHCGHCHMGQTANRGPCVFCGREDSYRIMPDVNCCERCSRTPELRPKLITSLRKGQRLRLASPPTEPLRQPKPKDTPARVAVDHDDLTNAPVI